MAVSPLMRLREFVEDQPLKFVAMVTVAVTLLRIILLFFYQTSLGPDEAQYWFWSRDLDFGYYSKPPMIAWAIALPTRIFGDWEWSVRLLSPVFIGGTAMFLFATARRLYGDAAGIWAAIVWLTVPAVMLGSTIMSTDIPLLFFWSMALYFLVSLSSGIGMSARWDSIGLGAAIGLGMLSKYAMVYFLIGWGLALIFAPTFRREMRIGKIMTALFVAGIFFAPNILWNLQNGMQTLNHTADNANWTGSLLNPDELLEFFGAQFGVFGPILFGAFVFGLATIISRLRQAGKDRDKDVLLLCFALPPLVIILVQALLSRAHANWAMTAYPAASILVIIWLFRLRARWVLLGSTVLHAVLGLFFVALLLNFTLADQLGMSNEVKRLRGWPETAAQIREAAQGLDGVIVDERENAAHFVWEWRQDPLRLMAFDLNGQKDSTYEHAFPFEYAQGERYLLVTHWPDMLCMYDGFQTIAPAGESFVDLHATRRGRPERLIELFEVADYTPRTRQTCDVP